MKDIDWAVGLLPWTSMSSTFMRPCNHKGSHSISFQDVRFLNSAYQIIEFFGWYLDRVIIRTKKENLCLRVGFLRGWCASMIQICARIHSISTKSCLSHSFLKPSQNPNTWDHIPNALFPKHNQDSRKLGQVNDPMQLAASLTLFNRKYYRKKNLSPRSYPTLHHSMSS